MTYEQAIAGYDELDVAEKSKVLYAHFGLAVYQAQMLEQQAINMVVIKNIADGRFESQEELDRAWLEYDLGKKMLGPLIRELRIHYSFDDVLATDLEEVLKMRNYFVHKYFRLNAEILQTDLGKKRMIKDFVEFTIKAKSVDVRLVEILDKINIEMGMTEKIIDEAKAVEEDGRKFSADSSYNTFR